MTDRFEHGVHLLRPADADEAALLRTAGLGRVTVHAPWRWTEFRRNNLDLTSLDHFLAPLREAGLPLQAVLGPGMPHLVPDHVAAADPDFVPRFCTWIGGVAAALPDIGVFRVEDNLNAAFLWDGLRTRKRRGKQWRDPDFRLTLLRSACTAVRDARPDAEVRITAHAGIPGWKAELRRWLTGGVSFDRLGLTINPCGLLPDPEMADRLGEAVEQATDVLARAGSDAPVEVSRTGYGTLRRAWSPRRQREFLERANASVVAAGGVGLHWWALRDQAHDDPILGYWTPARERHMGLLFYDSVPKPAMDELRVLATGGRFGEGA
ncbi:MAG: hypothetical protein GY898_08520 [Proteobacteria bacterium]|nr:hypothetical protein [Pseudomonadota bacterium]